MTSMATAKTDQNRQARAQARRASTVRAADCPFRAVSSRPATLGRFSRSPPTKAEGSAAHKGKTPSREKRSTREERLAKKRPSTRERHPAREECLAYKKCISPEKDIAQEGGAVMNAPCPAIFKRRSLRARPYASRREPSNVKRPILVPPSTWMCKCPTVAAESGPVFTTVR